MQREMKRALLSPLTAPLTWQLLLDRIHADMRLLQRPQAFTLGIHPTLIEDLYPTENDVLTTLLKAVQGKPLPAVKKSLQTMRRTARPLAGLYQGYQAGSLPFEDVLLNADPAPTIRDEAWVANYVNFVTPLMAALRANPKVMGARQTQLVYLNMHVLKDKGKWRFGESDVVQDAAHLSLAPDLGYLIYGFEHLRVALDPDCIQNQTVLTNHATNWLLFKRAYITLHGVVNSH